MTKAQPFFGGLPTEIETRKLIEHYGVPPAGLYPYAALADICGLSWPRDRARLKTVLARWRKRLERDYQLVSEGVSGVGVKVLAEGERTQHGTRYARLGTRKARRGLIRIALTDAKKIEDPKLRAEAEHAQQVAARILPTLAQNVKALTPPAPPAALPRHAMDPN